MGDISLDLVDLFERKYQKRFLLSEFLHEVSIVAELARETTIVQQRVLSDIYGIFGKDPRTGNLSIQGTEMLNGCRVSSISKTQTTAAYCVKVCIELAEDLSEELSMDTAEKKRKRSSLSSASVGKIQLWFEFEELCSRLKTKNGTADDMRCPCKRVSMCVWSSHGVGLDKRLLLDFNLLTAGESPSDSRRQCSYSNKCFCTDLSAAHDAWKKTAEAFSDESTENTLHGKSDYFTVFVDTLALMNLSNMISATLHGTSDEETLICGRGGENCLLFLLAMPYVDEAWGIHDAALDCAYPQDDEIGDDEIDDDNNDEIDDSDDTEPSEGGDEVHDD
jgi:hypothetical protein